MLSNRPWSWFAPLVGVAIAFLPASAHAYRYGTAASDPCHEDLAAAALRQTRIELANVLPLPLSSEDKAFADDLQFDLPPDMYDTAGATAIEPREIPMGAHIARPGRGAARPAAAHP